MYAVDSLKNITLLVGNNIEALEMCTFYEQPPNEEIDVQITCDVPTKGRFVKILAGGLGCQSNVLSICGIQVYGQYVHEEYTKRHGKDKIVFVELHSKYSCVIQCNYDDYSTIITKQILNINLNTSSKAQ